MLILCPSCATSYNLEPATLGTAGRSVRCVYCRNIWFALAPDLAQEVSIRRMSDVVAAAEASVGTTLEPPITSVPQVPLPDRFDEQAAAEPALDTPEAEPSIQD